MTTLVPRHWVNTDARIGDTSAVQCTTNAVEKTRCSALAAAEYHSGAVHGKTLANAHSILVPNIGSILRGHDMTTLLIAKTVITVAV